MHGRDSALHFLRTRVLHREAKNYKSGRQVQVHLVWQAIVMKNSQTGASDGEGGKCDPARQPRLFPAINLCNLCVYTALYVVEIGKTME